MPDPRFSPRSVVAAAKSKPRSQPSRRTTAAEEASAGAPARRRSMTVNAPLRLREDAARRVQVVVRREGGSTQATVYSRTDEDPPGWALHASAEVEPCPPLAPSDDAERIDLD